MAPRKNNSTNPDAQDGSKEVAAALDPLAASRIVSSEVAEGVPLRTGEDVIELPEEVPAETAAAPAARQGLVTLDTVQAPPSSPGGATVGLNADGEPLTATELAAHEPLGLGRELPRPPPSPLSTMLDPKRFPTRGNVEKKPGRGKFYKVLNHKHLNLRGRGVTFRPGKQLFADEWTEQQIADMRTQGVVLEEGFEG